MLHIYLPIAERSLDIGILLGMGIVVGFLSGLFGVGGGFLMTPILIFMGVPSAVAVGSSVNQLIASSVSGVWAHWRRGTVDFRMGAILLVGGLAGSVPGVYLLKALRAVGQVDLAIQLTYVLFLGVIGGLMFWESTRALLRRRRGPLARRRLHQHYWVHGLPMKMRFPRSRLYVSAIPPLVLGFLGGLLAAIMGVGGGFFLVPAMIYLLGMPTQVVAGTSLFQILFVAINVTFLQSVNNQAVDVFLALLLIVGAVVGAQFGTRIGARLPAEQFRALLALLVLLVCGKLLVDLVSTPADLFSLQPVQGHG